MPAYPIRRIAESDLAGFLAVDQHTSHGAPMSQRARANLLARLEFDRTLAAFDGGTIVGGAGRSASGCGCPARWPPSPG